MVFVLLLVIYQINIPMKTIIPNKECAKAMNRLAREEMKQKLLNDILLDLTICEIEGWDKKQYLDELKELITSLAP